MSVHVTFYSFFRDLTGVAETTAALPPDSRLSDLQEQLFARYPQLRPMQKSMLLAVGVDYQKPDFLLRDQDQVALFPPVQGG
ncbi:MAG TPA: MoaD/ThiS family protein [Verrucomicrobiae bacterium]|jgi:molybdopterin converting factor small subunit|nr:MoaD/ThiS family protein [Verrucomicrobiae bacterium]